MGYVINEKLENLRPYSPDLGECAIHLDANESFLKLPQEIREKIGAKLASVDLARYPDPLALGVRRAYGSYIGVDEKYITAGNGSDELISLLFSTFVQKGETAVMTEPDFSMYPFYSRLYECNTVIVKKSKDLTLTPEELIEAGSGKGVRMVIFSNPCNPTGQALGREDVLYIADALNDCLVVVDEAYMDFWGESILPDALFRKNLIVLRTCSKMGFAALRLGFAVANVSLTRVLSAAKSPYNVNALTQAAGEAVLSETKYLKQAAASLTASRESLYQRLREYEGARFRVFPSKANFVLVQSQGARELHEGFKSRGISVRLVRDDFLRITAGSPEENDAFFAALRELLQVAGIRQEVE